MAAAFSSFGASAARQPDRAQCASGSGPPPSSRGGQLLVVTPWLRERSALFGLCLRWTRGNVPEAEDLLSDACLRILEGRDPNGSHVASPFAFWTTVINNLGRDQLRRSRRWAFGYRGSDPGILQSLPASTVGAEQQMFLKECLAATGQRLMELSERQRNAVLLRSTGLAYGEIGDALSTSSANARKLVETARKALNRRRSCRGASPLRRQGSRRVLRARSYAL